MDCLWTFSSLPWMFMTILGLPSYQLLTSAGVTVKRYPMSKGRSPSKMVGAGAAAVWRRL